MVPIVLVPGLLCTAEVYGPQIAALWPNGPVTIASTLGADTMAAMAASILDTAPPRFALAGISMGGYVCFEIMRRAPERVTKLALLDTTARPDTPEQTAARRKSIDGARAGAFEALVTQLLQTILLPAHHGLVPLGLRMARAIGVDGMARQQEAIISRVDSRPSLGAISVPTLVLVGDLDPLTPPDRSEEIASAIPGARLVVVPHSGHVTTLEQPERVNHALVEWLTR